jgi:hypothetical protein
VRDVSGDAAPGLVRRHACVEPPGEGSGSDARDESRAPRLPADPALNRCVTVALLFDSSRPYECRTRRRRACWLGAREKHARAVAWELMRRYVMPRNGLLEHGEAAGKQLRGWTSMWAKGKSRVCSSTTTPPVVIPVGALDLLPEDRCSACGRGALWVLGDCLAPGPQLNPKREEFS